jgi:prevent-host-death family protein
LDSSGMTTISVSEARAHLPDLLTQVSGEQEITITRHGLAVAVLIAPEPLRRRKNLQLVREAAALRDLVDAARSALISPVEAMTPQRAEELIEDLRRGRDGR